MRGNFMKKIFLCVISAALFASCSMMQTVKLKQTGIIQGKGTSEIYIGMSSAQAKKILGKSPLVVSKEQEYNEYVDFGYVPEDELVFRIGFDFILEYNPENNLTEIPAWKLFFKNDKLVYINFSNYIYTEIPEKYCGIKPAACFNSEKTAMISTLGNDFKYDENENNQYYYYYKKGVFIILCEGVIKVINIFKPIN